VSDWSSDVCSSDLPHVPVRRPAQRLRRDRRHDLRWPDRRAHLLAAVRRRQWRALLPLPGPRLRGARSEAHQARRLVVVRPSSLEPERRPGGDLLTSWTNRHAQPPLRPRRPEHRRLHEPHPRVLDLRQAHHEREGGRAQVQDRSPRDEGQQQRLAEHRLALHEVWPADADETSVTVEGTATWDSAFKFTTPTKVTGGRQYIMLTSSKAL